MIRQKTTKDYLMESAAQLFSKHPIEKVTIMDICENCGLSTRTYYNYFRDKYDIINRCYVERFEEHVRDHLDTMTFHGLMIYLAEEVCKSPDFFRNVFQYTGQNNIRMSSVEPLVRLYVAVIENEHSVTLSEEEVNALYFFLYGILAYVEVLLQRPGVPDPKKSSSFCEKAVPGILQKYLIIN